MMPQSRVRLNTFPCKLYDLLEKADTLGYSQIISWQQGGKSFRVWNPKALVASILPHHFKQSKHKSFLRQLNTYHFRRITSGVNRGGYAHPSFVRGKPELCKAIKRMQEQNGSLVSSATKPDWQVSAVPCNFGSKSFFDVKDTLLPSDTDIVLEEQQSICHEARATRTTAITSKDLDVFVDLFEPSNTKFMNTQEPSFDSSLTVPMQGLELEPIPVLPVTSHREEDVEHTFIPPMKISNSDLQRSESTFPHKVYRMLQDIEKTHMDHIVSWINDGTAFRVHDTDAFVKNVLPLYFDQTFYESFRRQLNMYGFTRVTRGPLKGTCYHKNFSRQNPALIDLIARRKRPGKKRR